MSELTSQVKALDPKGREFAQVLDVMAEKTAALRRDEGKVPREVFISAMELAGVSPVIEVLVFDKENNLYLRRRRDEENKSLVEQKAWGGKLHIPGTTVFPAKRFEMNLYGLLEREVVGGPNESEKRRQLAGLYRSSETVGATENFVPERKTNGVSILMKVVIDDPFILQEGFEKVTDDNLSQVIEQHRPVVERVLKGKPGPLIFDTRGKV